MPITATENQRLGTIRLELRADLSGLMDAAGAQLGFTLEVPADGGTRSLTRQTALYNDSIAQGGGTLAYPVAKPGNSRHEYGAAFDVWIIAGGSADDGTGTDADYAQLAALGESLPGAPGLIAGYYFAQRGVGQKDLYHFQLNETLAQSQAAWAAIQKRTVIAGAAVVAGVVALFLIARR